MQANLFSYYCDDVRMEVGGKISFMGILGNELLLPHFPATIGRLMCVAELIAPKNWTTTTLTLQLRKEEEVIASADIPLADIEKLRARAGGNATHFTFRMIFELGSVNFETPTTMTAVAVCDGVDLAAPRLVIRQLLPEEQMKAQLGPQIDKLGHSNTTPT